jgi:glycosyltransferase involved in cell wall biosynthesis
MTISAVMPTFNRAGLLERAVRSMIEQERRPDEIIVVDDGSTDATEEVIAAHGTAVTYIRQANAGAAVARNTGVEHASGDFIAFLDSDDLWLPGHVEALDSARRATQGRAAVYFDDCYFSAPGSPADEDQTLWALAGFDPAAPFELSDDGFPWALLPLQPTMLQSSLISRRAYLDAGGLHPRLRLRHDTALFFELGLRHPLCAVRHIGTRMTPEADNRLTGDLPDSSAAYWHETVFMYQRLLSGATALNRSSSELAEIRARLATAHWRLARTASKSRHFRDTVVELGRAMRVSPVTVGRRVARRPG